jgi:hypothetical protein
VLYEGSVTLKFLRWSWLIPMEITCDRGRSVAEPMCKPMRPDLADASWPLSASQSMRPCTSCTDRRPYAACASVAHRTCALVDTRVALRRFCARPLTSPRPQCSGYAGYTQIILTRCKQKPFVAAIVIASHDSLGTSTREGSTARSYQLTTGFFAAATSVISNRASSTN